MSANKIQLPDEPAVVLCSVVECPGIRNIVSKVLEHDGVDNDCVVVVVTEWSSTKICAINIQREIISTIWVDCFYCSIFDY